MNESPSLRHWLRTYPEFKPLVGIMAFVGAIMLLPAVMLITLLTRVPPEARGLIIAISVGLVALGAAIIAFGVGRVRRYLDRYAQTVGRAPTREVAAVIERRWRGRNTYVRATIDGREHRPFAISQPAASQLVADAPWQRNGTLHTSDGKPFLLTFGEHRIWFKP